jgi:hypothetical protein
MKTKHIFVPVLDVGEVLPFVIRKTKTLKDSMEEQERAKKELVKFIDKLEKNFKESIYYMGMDIIAGKSYERFIFQKGGFFEIMVESPLAMNAHFVHEKRANNFSKSLKKTLRQIIPRNEIVNMFINSIEVQTEQDQGLTYEKWDKMKKIRNV